MTPHALATATRLVPVCGLLWLALVTLSQRSSAYLRGALRAHPPPPAPSTQLRKPRAYLHIGPHKTGSSFLQTKLCEAEAGLAHAGITIPTAPSCQPTPCFFKHFAGVAYQLLDEHAAAHPQYTPRPAVGFRCAANPVQGLAAALSAAANASSDVVISSEHFAMLGDAGVQTLAGMLTPRFDVRVILVYRDKLSHMLSFYTQWNKEATPPLTFAAFYWTYVSGIDAGASANDGVSYLAEGLFLSRMVRTYAKHFGMDSFTVINYDAARDRLWDVFVEEGLGVPAGVVGLAAGTTVAPSGADAFRALRGSNAPATNTPAAATARHPPASHSLTPARPSRHINGSPNAFALNVAAHYYAARWGAAGYGKPVLRRGRASPGVPDPPPGLPDMRCVRPLVEAVVDGLPQTCTSLANVVGPWVREERATLDLLAASGSRLVLFGQGGDARSPPPPNPPVQACDIDFEALMRAANATRGFEALLNVMRHVSTAVDDTCKVD